MASTKAETAIQRDPSPWMLSIAPMMDWTECATLCGFRGDWYIGGTVKVSGHVLNAPYAVIG